MITLSTARSTIVLVGIVLVVAACASPAAAPTAVAPTNFPAQPTQAPSSATASSVPSSQAVAAPIKKLNLNTATANDFFTTIPGFGNNMVREFLEYRPYASILQFRREIGKYVNTQQVAEYEKYVFVPIAFNESDAATLQQIPGLDAAGANALIAARPYASADAFLTKLAQYVSSDQVAIAKSYLK